MFDWLERMKRTLQQREQEAAHKRYVENHRQIQQAIHEELGFAQAFHNYMVRQYNVDVDEALRDCGEHAEDWEDCVNRCFVEWKNGCFDDIDEAFEDLWAEITTMLEWEGNRHLYP